MVCLHTSKYKSLKRIDGFLNSTVPCLAPFDKEGKVITKDMGRIRNDGKFVSDSIPDMKIISDVIQPRPEDVNSSHNFVPTNVSVDLAESRQTMGIPDSMKNIMDEPEKEVIQTVPSKVEDNKAKEEDYSKKFEELEVPAQTTSSEIKNDNKGKEEDNLKKGDKTSKKGLRNLLRKFSQKFLNQSKSKFSEKDE